MTRKPSISTSDSEDLVLLDEIKALDDLLSPKKNDFQSPSNHIPNNNRNSDEEIVQGEDYVGNYVHCQSGAQEVEKIDAYQAAFNCNKELINCLLVAKEEIKSILQECEAKLEIVDKKLHSSNSATSSSRCTFVCNVGIPYFKNKDFFPAPKNQDTKSKLYNRELSITSIGQLCRWTPKDRKTLLNAIRQQAIADVLQNNGIKDPSTCTDKSSKNENSTANVLPKDFHEMIGPLKSREFDWLKIAAADFDCRHTADECRVMWNIYLHPDINKSKWTKREINKLKNIARRYNYQDWEQIAKCLDTKRSGYQCFIKYSSEKKLALTSNQLWSEAEDQQLLTLIDRFTIGNFIPWADITRYIRGRTKQQIYYRWMYSLAPHLKKGRFTKEEDETLVKAIGKFGRNFTKISAAIMPHRSTVQLSDHYQTLISREKGDNRWKLNDDMRLIELHEKFGSNWTKIAKYFTNKNRTQVRHRYSALKKKGFILDFADVGPADAFKEEENMDYIDKQLIQYFCFAQKSQPGRKQKFYRSEELEKKTEQLHDVLTLLNANFQIPDNLTDYQLSEKNTQLLYSLKDYREKFSKRQECNSETVEQVRFKMFGPRPNLDDSERFVPALPFGMLSTVSNKHVRTRKCKIGDNSKHVIELKMDFDTPSNVLDFIGGPEIDLEFDKISVLLRRGSSRGNTQETFPVCNRTSLTFELYPSISTCSQEMQENSLSPCTSHFAQKDKQFEIHASTTQVEHIKPSYDTLTGYQNLQLWMEGIFFNHGTPVAEDAVLQNETAASRKAYELLKQRLIQLFKYPIHMSKISIPQIHGSDTSFIFDLHKTKNGNKGQKRTAKNVELSKRVRREAPKSHSAS